MRNKTLIIDDEPTCQTTAHRFTWPPFLMTLKLLEKPKTAPKAWRRSGAEPRLDIFGYSNAGLSGFEMLHLMDKAPIIVFCTAYDQ
jgi:two-component system LytT family response regulator